MDTGWTARTMTLPAALIQIQMTIPLVPAAQAAAATDPLVQPLFDLADLDAKTAGAIAAVLRPVLSVSILLFIVRIVLSW